MKNTLQTFLVVSSQPGNGRCRFPGERARELHALAFLYRNFSRTGGVVIDLGRVWKNYNIS